MTQAQNPPPLLCKRPRPAAVPAPSPVGVAAARPTDRLRLCRPEVLLPSGAWPAPPSPPREAREGLRVRRAAGGGLRGRGGAEGERSARGLCGYTRGACLSYKRDCKQ